MIAWQFVNVHVHPVVSQPNERQWNAYADDEGEIAVSGKMRRNLSVFLDGKPLHESGCPTSPSAETSSPNERTKDFCYAEMDENTHDDSCLQEQQEVENKFFQLQILTLADAKKQYEQWRNHQEADSAPQVFLDTFALDGYQAAKCNAESYPREDNQESPPTEQCVKC